MIISQTFQPRIEVFRSKNSTGIVFDGRGRNNLLSYEFTRSLTISGGNFSFSFKDTNQSLDKLAILDVVRIYEHDKLVYIGVITDISFSGNAQDGRAQKTVTVRGKSVEYLFDMLQISLDISALALAGHAANSDVLNIQLVTELSTSQGTKAVSIEDGLNTAFEHFKKALDEYNGVAATQILTLIKDVFGSDVFKDIADCGKIQFKYPLSSNLYRDKTIKFLDLIRTLLPSPVYEIYGTIGDNDKPKIVVRECPFDSSAWVALNSFRISPVLLRDYSLLRSCDEVYTEFITYVEGSDLSPEFYRKVYATEEGNARAYPIKDSNEEKRKIYGYRPLEVTFSGFYSGKNDSETAQLNNTLNDSMRTMNERIAKWFGQLDDMYKGSVTFVNADVEKASLGERAIIGTNEYYITSERHSWSCTGVPTITYSLDRGGKYNSGEFSPCENMSKFLGEWD